MARGDVGSGAGPSPVGPARAATTRVEGTRGERVGWGGGRGERAALALGGLALGGLALGGFAQADDRARSVWERAPDPVHRRGDRWERLPPGRVASPPAPAAAPPGGRPAPLGAATLADRAALRAALEAGGAPAARAADLLAQAALERGDAEGATLLWRLGLDAGGEAPRGGAPVGPAPGDPERVAARLLALRARPSGSLRRGTLAPRAPALGGRAPAGPAALRLRWTHARPGAHFTDAAAGEDLVVALRRPGAAASSDAVEAVALEAGAGRLRWSRRIPGAVRVARPAADAVALAVDDAAGAAVVGLDARDGASRWRWSAGGADDEARVDAVLDLGVAWPELAGATACAVVRGGERHVVLLDPRGGPRWSVRLPVCLLVESRRAALGAVAMTALGDRLFVVADGVVSAVSLARGALLWAQGALDDVAIPGSPPAAVGAEGWGLWAVHAPLSGRPARLVCLDPLDGRPLRVRAAAPPADEVGPLAPRSPPRWAVLAPDPLVLAQLPAEGGPAAPATPLRAGAGGVPWPDVPRADAPLAPGAWLGDRLVVPAAGGLVALGPEVPRAQLAAGALTPRAHDIRGGPGFVVALAQGALFAVEVAPGPAAEGPPPGGDPPEAAGLAARALALPPGEDLATGEVRAALVAALGAADSRERAAAALALDRVGADAVPAPAPAAFDALAARLEAWVGPGAGSGPLPPAGEPPLVRARRERLVDGDARDALTWLARRARQRAAWRRAAPTASAAVLERALAGNAFPGVAPHIAVTAPAARAALRALTPGLAPAEQAAAIDLLLRAEPALAGRVVAAALARPSDEAAIAAGQVLVRLAEAGAPEPLRRVCRHPAPGLRRGALFAVFQRSLEPAPGRAGPLLRQVGFEDPVALNQELLLLWGGELPTPTPWAEADLYGAVARALAE